MLEIMLGKTMANWDFVTPVPELKTKYIEKTRMWHIKSLAFHMTW